MVTYNTLLAACARAEHRTVEEQSGAAKRAYDAYIDLKRRGLQVSGRPPASVPFLLLLLKQRCRPCLSNVPASVPSCSLCASELHLLRRRWPRQL